MKTVFTFEEKHRINTNINEISMASEYIIEEFMKYDQKGRENHLHDLFDETNNKPVDRENLEDFMGKLREIESFISDIKKIVGIVDPKDVEIEKLKGSQKNLIHDLVKISVDLGKLSLGQLPDGMEPEPKKVNKIQDGWYHHKEGNCEFLSRYNDDILNLQFIRSNNTFKTYKLLQKEFKEIFFVSQEQCKEFWDEYYPNSKPLHSN